MKSKGVVLMAFGKREYYYMAAHMAMSIKHYSNVDITLVHDMNIKHLPNQWRQFFDGFVEMEAKHLYRLGSIDPGWAKCHIYEYIPYDINIYFDVDGICLKDVIPLFDCDKFYATEVIGEGGRHDDIEYSYWATNNNVWKNFGLTTEDTYRTIQTSFCLIRRSQDARSLFARVKRNFNYPVEDLQWKWGGTMPDELIVGGSCAQIEHNPSIGEPVVFFGNKNSKLSFREIKERFYINSLYGNGKGRTLVKDQYKDWYDRTVMKMARSKGLSPIGKHFQLMKSKHAG